LGFDAEFTGLAAAALTTGSFLPQVIRVWQTRDTKAISLGMYTMFTLGTLLWLVYGITIQSPSIIIANGLTFCLAASILVLKLRHG
jgi:MtN3 and saliva related transmembrane protein